jgi:hypothetical protein
MSSAYRESTERQCRNRHGFPRRNSSGIAEFDAEQAGAAAFVPAKAVIALRKFLASERSNKRPDAIASGLGKFGAQPSMMPEDGEQQDDWQRDTEQPEQRTSTETHVILHLLN